MRFSFVSMSLLSTLFLALTLSYGAEPSIPLPSFLYEGKPADIATFKVAELSSTNANDVGCQVRTYTAPDGKLQLTVTSKSYKKYPIVEQSVELKNLSKTDATGIVSNFRPLAMTVASPQGGDVELRYLCGSLCRPEDFMPNLVALKPKAEFAFKTTCGRSSNNYIPFIELNLNEKSGYIFAIGWSGSWDALFTNEGKQVTVSAGMNETRFKLLPGESIRQPSIVVFHRTDTTRRAFLTLVHRFMIDHKSPRDAQGKVIPPILALTAGGGNKTPQMLQDVLQYSLDNKLPFDTFWIDAGWYGDPHEDEHLTNCGPNWWKHVGNWIFNTKTHPTGDMLPIANAVHKAGMKFLLWFEPERIMEGSPILKSHPEFRTDNLLRYDNPETLQWIQSTVYDIIGKHKIDIYRQDFNIDPGPIWKKIDGEQPDRVGITEAKHIAGMYKFLDDMRVRFPGILQENCASGGRRIDIEMVPRAHSYCRSDYYIGPKPDDHAIILGQNATLNLTPYLPFQGGESNCAAMYDDYAMMSVVSSGSVFTPTDFDGGIVRRKFSEQETRWFQKSFAIANRMRQFYLGDFFPLTDETGPGNDVWCAWQLDRTDMNAGFVIAFRRAKATEATKTFALGNIDVNAQYELELFDGSKKTVSGKELANLQVELAPRSFFLAFYTKR